MITVTRYHDFCAGHRVAGHENKCAHLHGHNYRVHFTCQMGSPEMGVQLANHLSGVSTPELDELGRVIDFNVIKAKLCTWLEDNWDHKFLLWDQDKAYTRFCRDLLDTDMIDLIDRSIVGTEFNPTAENMAKYLVEEVGPQQLEGTGVVLIRVVVEETRKCSATYEVNL